MQYIKDAQEFVIHSLEEGSVLYLMSTEPYVWILSKQPLQEGVLIKIFHHLETIGGIYSENMKICGFFFPHVIIPLIKEGKIVTACNKNELLTQWSIGTIPAGLIPYKLKQGR